MNETPERPRLMKEICESQSLSEKFTSRLVIPLREKGMIHSLRGKLGGFRLARAPSDITLLEVIETLQGDIFLVDCLEDGSSCPRSVGCPSRTIWADVNGVVRSALKGITLETVIARVTHNKGVPASLAEYTI